MNAAEPLEAETEAEATGADLTPPHGLAKGVMSPNRMQIARAGLDQRWHDDLYHRLTRLSWSAFFLGFGVLFLGINILFACAYQLDPNGLSSDAQLAGMWPFFRAFFFSVHTIATVGYGNIVPRSPYANAVVVVETACGILLIALTSGVMFARFSRPTARFMFSRPVVIRPYQGVPTLMLRVANLRTNLIINTNARVTLLRWERDGDNWLRRFHDLAMVRTNNPIFFLSWQLHHPIDAASPLFGMSHAEMLAADLELVVLMSGTDTTLAQPIHALHVYGAEDFRMNHRFVDVIDNGADGRRRINYQLLHDTVAIEDFA